MKNDKTIASNSVEKLAEEWYEANSKHPNDPCAIDGFIAGYTQRTNAVIELIEARIKHWEEKAPMYDLIVDELTNIKEKLNETGN